MKFKNLKAAPSVKFSFNAGNMSPAVFVPQFSSTQKHQADPQSQCQRNKPGIKRGNKRAKHKGVCEKYLLNDKKPKLNNNTLSYNVTEAAEEEDTPRRLMCEAAGEKNKTSVGHGGETRCPDSDPVRGDVFSFSQRIPSKPVTEKEQAKLTVLRTISKMLEENQQTRQRLASLSQTH